MGSNDFVNKSRYALISVFPFEKVTKNWAFVSSTNVTSSMSSEIGLIDRFGDTDAVPALDLFGFFQKKINSSGKLEKMNSKGSFMTYR